MAPPYHNLGSKLDRAIVAYLIAQFAGAAADTQPSNSIANKPLPNTVVQSRRGSPDTLGTGSYLVDVVIMIKYPAAQAAAEGNPQASRVAADRRLAKVYDALMQGDDAQSQDGNLRATAAAITAAGRALTAAGSVQDQANNADMADFTVRAWYDKGFERGEPDDESCSWVEKLYFQASAVPSNVD